MCRTSTLYLLLFRRSLRDSFYKHHHDLNTPKASDALIYTEGVVICKTDEDLPKRMSKEDWVSVDVITVAAPDLRTTSNIHAALIGNGAFGYGAFENNPEVVARAYKIALEEFPKVFKRIEFAVYCSPNDDTNYQVFKEILTKRCI